MKTEPVEHRRRSVCDPLADCQQRGRPGQYGVRGEGEYGGESVAYPAWVTRVQHLGQALQQARDFLGGNHGLLPELVKGRRVHR